MIPQREKAEIADFTVQKMTEDKSGNSGKMFFHRIRDKGSHPLGIGSVVFPRKLRKVLPLEIIASCHLRGLSHRVVKHKLSGDAV